MPDWGREMLITLAFSLPAGDAPPTEFRLFRQGKNDTEKGVFTFDAKAAKVVMARYEKRGTRCFFDYNHASLEKDPKDPKESAKSAGWFDLEVREGELWATNINWTPPALEAFQKKEFAYFSPAFSTDGEGRVVDLINCALTNLPATHDIPQLVAADRRTELSVAFSTINCAVDCALRDVYAEEDSEGRSPKCPWIRELYDDSVVFEFDGELLRQSYSYDEATDKAQLTGKAQEVRVEYVPVAPAATLGTTVESGGAGTTTIIRGQKNSRASEAHGTTSALSGNGETTMDEDTKKTLEDLKAQVAKYKKMAEDSEEELKKTKKLASDKRVVDEDNDEMKKASRIVAAARTATGKTEADDVAGALVALSSAYEQNKVLTGRIEALELVSLTARVDEAIKAGKLLPAKREVMLAAGAKALGTYLDMVGDVRVGPPIGEHQPDPNKKEPTTSTEQSVTLTSSERAQMNALGISEERMVELKRETIAGKELGTTFTLPGVAEAQPIIK
jgi:phage I-like protein